LTTAGIGAAFGYRFLAGLCLGGLITMMIVISGLAAIVLAVPALRLVLLFASVGYLVYLAWRIASAGSLVGFKPATTSLGFINGLVLQFINPKAYVVGATLFSGFAFMPEAPVAEVVVKLLLFNAIWVPVHLIWLGAGVKLGSMNLNQRTGRVINMGMAISLLVVVFVALLSVR
jgi:threonine/homoserine/homoserine lactone efflux protein